MTIEEKIAVWLKTNAEECKRFEKKAASIGDYKGAIELEGMATAYKKAAMKIESTKWQ